MIDGLVAAVGTTLELLGIGLTYAVLALAIVGLAGAIWLNLERGAWDKERR